MSKTYTTTDRVYHYPSNGAPRVFIAGKGEEIDYDLAVRLGLVKDEPKKAEPKKVAVADVENKAIKPDTKNIRKTSKE